MAQEMETKWIMAWIVVHSVVILGLVFFILFATVVTSKKNDGMAILLHNRISEVVSRTDEQQDEITRLRLKYDPHARVEALEKWQRTFCTAPKIEACAQLGPVNK